VDEDGDDERRVPLAAAVSVHVLLGARHAQDDRVDELQVAGIGGERDPDRVPGAERIVPRGAVVVLHVPRAGIGHPERASRRRALLELGEDLRVRTPP